MLIFTEDRFLSFRGFGSTTKQRQHVENQYKILFSAYLFSENTTNRHPNVHANLCLGLNSFFCCIPVRGNKPFLGKEKKNSSYTSNYTSKIPLSAEGVKSYQPNDPFMLGLTDIPRHLLL